MDNHDDPVVLLLPAHLEDRAYDLWSKWDIDSDNISDMELNDAIWWAVSRVTIPVAAVDIFKSFCASGC